MTAPDSFGSPDGRTCSTPGTAGQAAASGQAGPAEGEVSNYRMTKTVKDKYGKLIEVGRTDTETVLIPPPGMGALFFDDAQHLQAAIAAAAPSPAGVAQAVYESLLRAYDGHIDLDDDWDCLNDDDHAAWRTAVGAAPAPAASGTLRSELEATVRIWREESEPYRDETADEIARRGGFRYCADELAQVLARHPQEPQPQAAPELAAAMAETRQLRELVDEMTAWLRLNGRPRVAKVGIWRKKAALPPLATPADAERQDPYMKLCKELDGLRELLGDIGVLAANAPEDGAFAVCEDIAMRIAAMDVPDNGRHPDGCTCQFCREDEREERERADREDDDSMADIIPEDWRGEAMT